MTNAERAKQFMPFAALKGFEEALKEAEFIPQEKLLLGEDAQEELDRKLRELVIGEIVTAVYYAEFQYVSYTGPLIKVDKSQGSVLHVGDVRIPFEDLYDIRF